jgi:recombination associated protein RdgC
VISNATIFRIPPSWTPSAAQVEESLQKAAFVECAASQNKSSGFVPPRGEKHGALLESVAGQWIAKLKIETRSVPPSAVNRAVEAKIAEIEAQTGRKPGRKEKKELKEDTMMSMLPMAFSKESACLIWFDLNAGLLIIDSASQAKTDEVMTALIKNLEGFAPTLWQTNKSPQSLMAEWLSSEDAPANFSVDRECELKATDESKSVVKYGRHPLDIEEVRQHILQGKLPTRLALTWNNHVSFVLTESMIIKKISFLDVVYADAMSKGADDNFDADVAIMTAELAKLIPDLAEELGGVPELL